MSDAEMHMAAGDLAPTVGSLGMAPRAAFDRLSAMGFRHVQLGATTPGMRPRDLTASARRDLAAVLSRRSLAVSGLDAWVPVEHLCDAVNVDRAVAAVLGTIEMAEAFGRAPVSVVLPAVPTDGDDPAEGARAAIRAHAEHHGVELADHCVPPPDAGSWPPLGLDPAAWLAAAADPVDALVRLGPRLVTIRLCDLLTSGMRGPVGDPVEGRLDVAAYRRAITLGGWERPVVVDARQWINPWDGLVQSAAAWAGAGSAIAP